MTSSNIQPLIIIQATTKHQGLVDAIAMLSPLCPRTVVIAGSPDIVVRTPFQRVTTKVSEVKIETLITLPLESIGAAILRRAARREPIHAPMESRDARRDRQITERKSSE